MRTKWIIWIKENDHWEEQGDGPLTKITAARIVSELQHDFPSIKVKMLRQGEEP